MTYPWAAGEVLTAADLNAYAGLVLVKTQTVGTAVASVTVSNVFSSTFDNYRIAWTGITSTTAGSSALIQMGSTTTNYYSNFIFIDIGGAIQTASRNNSVGHFDWCNSIQGGGYVDMTAPNRAENTFVFAPFHNSNDRGGFSTSRLNDTTAYTAFTLKPTSGTLTGGTIRVYGYNNG